MADLFRRNSLAFRLLTRRFSLAAAVVAWLAAGRALACPFCAGAASHYGPRFAWIVVGMVTLPFLLAAAVVWQARGLSAAWADPPSDARP